MRLVWREDEVIFVWGCMAVSGRARFWLLDMAWFWARKGLRSAGRDLLWEFGLGMPCLYIRF